MCIRDSICIDCPVEFKYEDAQIGDLYTPEAYQYMKRLEFKSILTRFAADASADEKTSSLEERFKLVTDLKEAEKLIAGAAKAPVLGVQLITATKAAAKAAGEMEQLSFSFDESGALESGKKAKEGLLPVAGMALCAGEEEIYCLVTGESLTEEWLLAQASSCLLYTSLPHRLRHHRWPLHGKPRRLRRLGSAGRLQENGPDRIRTAVLPSRRRHRADHRKYPVRRVLKVISSNSHMRSLAAIAPRGACIFEKH